ncbi:hypothetical protein A2631_02900 [Candidatus Daviesbacteria bacterium RIFCSPHIGHO2_01_FULL_44_29]|uniref:Glycosyl transferase family 1 domain-containing protein n=1 Tax=Candidatus Daviesbacteria bacterium RIFCSPHIGHO2_02_FULL_43_12 TaxID=1797776 RepID=A0A1F5KKB6_9BACT|nr:MAG: hypothetical protein A2631_02900 [Candidatus Daviesbacteria bacterium RIFCSPHIGHO2_01_FULL_44_29]OGE40815.1 MAG: hypothetical protein A3E86_02450 [Candidatus Daviesbacteria bacterium RIFCSPHIGHO2_12_FULL_47_45]OGE41332.1 MAG: hypothetical protein A3D25_02295 [Candidatus Daviesbacteria bacterium RIFCSPHIGHO2_02_FULL_43_12]OGE69533.1 MAG: hypothetical protein A3B55_04035 [Candidatus Daviesbacteria bacterium RIFCSPLOWO2_01_FULL_43_15]
MRILILNWRDFKDPRAGGAEVLTQEVAKRLVSLGHQVEQHNASYPGALRQETIDGVNFTRHGNYLTTYIYSFLYAFLHHRKFDVIVEEVHGVPYFSVFFVPSKIVVLACEVAKNHWSLTYPFPIDKIGRLLEKLYFNLYKKTPFLTISPSSRNELVKEGIKKQMITVIPMGLNATFPAVLPAKEKTPTIVFLGRLVPIKGIEDAIRAAYLISKKLPNMKLWIIGAGELSYQKKLEELVKSLGIEKLVVFWGFVSEAQKFDLLAKAHVLLVPSKNEGWGLIVPEAGIVGTPAVVYDVNGLRDIVQSQKTGIIASSNDPEGLADGALRLLGEKDKYKIIRQHLLDFAKGFTWEETTKTSLEVFAKVASPKSSL